MDSRSRFGAYVGRVEDIRPGSSRLVRIAGREIAVFAVGAASSAASPAAEYFAIDNACPHYGAELVDARVRNRSVVCPWHGWHVSLTTGECFEAPCRPAETYPTEIRSGQLFVLIPRTTPAPEPALQTVNLAVRSGVL